MTENLPRNTWDITLLVRKRGALGVFESKTFRVRAEHHATAVMWALDDAHDEDLEVNGVPKAEKLS